MMDEDGSQPWLVVVSKPNSERKAERWLSAAGWGVYCPLVAETTITAGSIRTAARPMFPRYLFAQLPDMFSSLDPVSILSQPGVSDLVRAGSSERRFARLAHEVISGIRLFEHDGILDAETDPPPQLERGDPVEANLAYGGIAYTVVGTFLRMQSKDRAIVFVKMFGQMREAVVTLDKIAKLLANGAGTTAD